MNLFDANQFVLFSDKNNTGRIVPPSVGVPDIASCYLVVFLESSFSFFQVQSVTVDSKSVFFHAQFVGVALYLRRPEESRHQNKLVYQGPSSSNRYLA